MIMFTGDIPPVYSQPTVNKIEVEKKVLANNATSFNNKVSNVPSWAYKGATFMDSKNVTIKIGAVDLKPYTEMAKESADDIKSRAGQKGQFLNWIGVLPQNQLKNLDNIYALANQAKADGATKLAVLGIGGSRHTTEAMMKMLGKDADVKFYSSIDPISFDRFAKTLDLDNTKFLVVSKSGGTLETTVAYNNAKALMQKHLGREDVSDKFIAMTDASSEKSNLRKAVDRGEIKLSGLVHDDVGGRFSIFDDATLFTMAYAGVSKEDTEKMLKASLKAQNEFSNPNINENEALQLAAFNVKAKQSGKNKHFVEYFGDSFSGATLWEKQMKNESLKARISTDTNVGPGYLHYNAEADLDKANQDSFFTFVSVKTDDKAANALMHGAKVAYSAQHPVSEIELKDLSPESIARFIELKHFETLYTGNMLRRTEGNVTPKTEAMPEVLQPNVEIYKKEVKKVLN
jgi:glucose-6-phosphate isomerase